MDLPRVSGAAHPHSTPQFALVNVIGLAINNLVLVNLAALFSPFIPDPFDYNLAKAIAIIIVLF